MPYAHLHMAQKSGVGVFVVRFNAKAPHKRANRKDDALGLAVLEQAFARIDHAMRAALIHAAQNAPLTCMLAPNANVGRNHFVAVIARVFHPQDGRNDAFLIKQPLEKRLDFALFASELLRIGNREPLAPPASAINWAGEGPGANFVLVATIAGFLARSLVFRAAPLGCARVRGRRSFLVVFSAFHACNSTMSEARDRSEHRREHDGHTGVSQEPKRAV